MNRQIADDSPSGVSDRKDEEGVKVRIGCGDSQRMYRIPHQSETN